METTSLRDRLQQKACSSEKTTTTQDVESDVDDDITVEECHNLMEKLKQQRGTFTQVQEHVPSREPHNTSLNDDESESEIIKVPSKAKKKRTPAEREELKKQKEREKLEKNKKRQELKMEKEIEKERLRAIKSAEAMSARSDRKDECLDRMQVVIDPCVVQQKGGGDILKDLQDIGVRYELKELPVVCCVGWMRESVEFTVDENRQVKKTSSYSEEAHIVHNINAHELATRIEAEKDGITGDAETFTQLVQNVKETFPSKKVTIVVVGINAYHRLVKSKQNEEFRKKALGDPQLPAVKRKKKDVLVPSVTKDDIENHLITIQLTTNISIRFCEDMSEFSKLISSFTKAMAEAPFKKAPVSALQFSTVQSQNRASFKICDDGHGLFEVWNQQLQQFFGVRNDTSSAIVQLYPTPLSLMQAYQNISSHAGEKLLEDIQVRRGTGALQTKRRVGPELSKKIYKLFTSYDGDESLGK